MYFTYYARIRYVDFTYYEVPEDPLDMYINCPTHTRDLSDLNSAVREALFDRHSWFGLRQALSTKSQPSGVNLGFVDTVALVAFEA